MLILTSSSELCASERFRFSTINVELERFEFDDGASVSSDEVQPRFDRRDAQDAAVADAADAAPDAPVLVVLVAAAAAAATADGPLITSSSSSELC